MVGWLETDVVERAVELAANCESIISWNDELGRTKEQVLTVLKIAASLPGAQTELSA